MFFRTLAILAACVGTALVGCDSGGGPEESEQRAVSSCRAASAPSLSVGGIQPPAHTFGEVSDASRLPDGSVAVADRQARSISIFNERGDLVRTLGRGGEGPGEFLDPVGIVVKGDTLLVWDWDQLRVTEFHLSSDDVHLHRIDGLANPTSQFGDLPTGFVVGTHAFSGSLPESGSWFMELAVVRSDLLRPSLDTLLSFRYRTSQWVDKAIRLSGSPTFGPTGTFVAGGGRIYWAEGDSALVQVWENGRTERIEWDWPTRSVSPGDVDVYLRRWLARTPENVHEAITKQVTSMPVADVFPTVADLVTDVDGGVWVGIYPIPADSLQTWLRFDNGRLTCRVMFPLSFEPTEGGRTWLLGVASDELDVQRVELWSLETGS